MATGTHPFFLCQPTNQPRKSPVEIAMDSDEEMSHIDSVDKLDEDENTATLTHSLQQQLLQQDPKLLQIGNFKLGETIGVGTFGKVKSKSCLHIRSKI